MVSLMSYVMYLTKSKSKPFYIGFFVAFFDNNNPAFHKTNSLGKTLDTRQKKFCAPLVGSRENVNTKVCIKLVETSILTISKALSDFVSF